MTSHVTFVYCAAELCILAILCAFVLVGRHPVLDDCPAVDLCLSIRGHPGQVAEHDWND